MSRIAVLVDAGYLFVQGSTTLTGSKKKRTDITLDKEVVLAELLQSAEEKSNKASLLRIYGYDGAAWLRSPTPGTGGYSQFRQWEAEVAPGLTGCRSFEYSTPGQHSGFPGDGNPVREVRDMSS